MCRKLGTMKLLISNQINTIFITQIILLQVAFCTVQDIAYSQYREEKLSLKIEVIIDFIYNMALSNM